MSPPHARTSSRAPCRYPERPKPTHALHVPCVISGAICIYARTCIAAAPAPPLLLTLSHPPEYRTHMPHAASILAASLASYGSGLQHLGCACVMYICYYRSVYYASVCKRTRRIHASMVSLT